jgi:hypothetical protein
MRGWQHDRHRHLTAPATGSAGGQLQTPYEPDPRLHQAALGQRALYALYWLESETSNGGLHQYFWNPTGMLADEAVQGARRLRLSGYADLLEQEEDPAQGAQARLNLAYRLVTRNHPGDLDRARPLLEQAQATAHGLGLAGVEGRCRSLLDQLDTLRLW